MPRPRTHHDSTKIILDATNAKSKLQERSERRAIVQFVLDEGGSTTLGAIDEHFGYDCRSKTMALVRGGWLRAEEPKAPRKKRAVAP